MDAVLEKYGQLLLERSWSWRHAEVEQGPTHENKVKQHFWPFGYFLSCERTQQYECEMQKIRRCMHTDTHIRDSRSSSTSGNKLVRKASDKRARAHCPGIRDEQRCENVTTNSRWSPNVTFPLHSDTPPFLLLCSYFPSFESVSPSLLPFFLHFHCSPLILQQCFTFISSKGQRWEESERVSFFFLIFLKLCSFPLCPSLLSVLPWSSPVDSSIHVQYLSIHPFTYHINLNGSWSLGQQDNQPGELFFTFSHF